MITAFKGRQIDHTKPCKVYRNLNGDQSKIWSIQQGGLVVAHADILTVKDAEFVVSEAGTARVRREGRKNVHAYVRGFVAGGSSTTAETRGNPIQVGYNPYTSTRFHTRIEGVQSMPVVSAFRAYLTDQGRLYAWGVTTGE